MISIIISSHRPEIHGEIEENIKKTIGLNFEIIFIDNKNKYSLSEAYNLGASRAKYEYLCFVHNDIIFKTKDWGNTMVDIMERDSSVGLIGVAGTKFLSRFSLGWHCPFFSDKFLVGRVIQMDMPGDDYHLHNYSIKQNDVEEVVSIDGIFMFTKKVVWEKVNFDQNALKGFHGYDIDFSISTIIIGGCKVVVSKYPILQHSSFGDNRKEWFDSNKLVLKKWRKHLPMVTNEARVNGWTILMAKILLFLRYLKKDFELLFFYEK